MATSRFLATADFNKFGNSAQTVFEQMKNKTTITVETWQRTTVYKYGQNNRAWCESCAAETTMLSPDEAARFIQTTAREIFRAIENGAFHFNETTDGALLVCGNSLKQIQKCLPQAGEQK
jgi:hypothetical protein